MSGFLRPSVIVAEGLPPPEPYFNKVGLSPEGPLRIAIKPNLTWPDHRAGVTTTPDAIRHVCGTLLEGGHAVTLVESDGGYGTFDADIAFDHHGLRSLESLGVQLMNLSRQPTVKRLAGGLEIDMARPLMEEFDLFINMPVPKVHVMTRYTGAVKNHWGTIPTDMRLRLHHRMAPILGDIIRLLPRQVVVMDGTFFLDQTGPIDGTAIRKDVLIVSNHPLAADTAALRIMGWEIAQIDYLVKIAKRLGFDLDGIDGLPDRSTGSFTLKRSAWNYAALAAFKSRRLTYLGYESRLAGPLHRIKEASERLLIRGAPEGRQPDHRRHPPG